jgi:hypothetical protein
MTQYRLTVAGVYANGRTWSFRQHYSSAASLATILADWSGAWTTAWTTATTGLATVYATGTVLTSYSAAVLTGIPYREGLKTVSAVSHAGTASGDNLPPANAILVSRRSAQVGARNRGRTYLPAPAEAVQADGTMDVTNAGHVSTTIGVVRTTMTGAGHTPVIYNVKVSAADPVVQTNKTITIEEVDRVLRTQRRREEKLRAVYI